MNLEKYYRQIYMLKTPRKGFEFEGIQGGMGGLFYGFYLYNCNYYNLSRQIIGNCIDDFNNDTYLVVNFIYDNGHNMSTIGKYVLATTFLELVALSTQSNPKTNFRWAK